MLNLESLQFFCDVIDTQSFSRAASKNFVSQSAVSQRLRTLEEACGQKLLDRGQGRGGVSPTEAGRILYEGSKRLLREAFALENQLQSMGHDVSGALRVATVYSVGLHALPPRLKPFLAAHPQITVHLEYKRTEQVYQEVLEGTVDVGIVACPTAKRGLEVVPFGAEEMVLICAPEHALSRYSQLSLRQLEGMPFTGFDNDIPTRKLIEHRLQNAGVRVRQETTFENIETIKSIVEIGNSVSIVPDDTVRQEVREGTLVAIPFVPTDTFLRPTGLLLKKTSARRAVVSAFVAAMAAK